MDIQMPIMDGYEAIQKFRSLEGIKKWEKSPVIALTANAFSEDREKAFKSGFSDYISKPFKKEQILAVLFKYLVKQNIFELNNISEADEITSESSKYAQLPEFDERGFDNTLHNSLGGSTEFMLKLLEVFLTDSIKYLNEFIEAEKKLDNTTLKRVTHTIKSNGASLGLTKLSEICKLIETKDFNTLGKKEKEELFNDFKIEMKNSFDIITEISQKLEKNEAA